MYNKISAEIKKSLNIFKLFITIPGEEWTIKYDDKNACLFIDSTVMLAHGFLMQDGSLRWGEILQLLQPLSPGAREENTLTTKDMKQLSCQLVLDSRQHLLCFLSVDVWLRLVSSLCLRLPISELYHTDLHHSKLKLLFDKLCQPVASKLLCWSWPGLLNTQK